MKKALGTLLVLACIFPAMAQRIGDGLWNAGRAFMPVPASDANRLVLEKQLTLVNLYPAFAVVRNSMDILNPGQDTILTTLHWTDSLTTVHPVLTALANSPSMTRTLVMNGDTLALDADLRFLPGVNRLVTYQITPNHQAILSREGNVKEGSAFVYSAPPSPFQRSGLRQVLVQLQANLTMTNVMAVEPQDAVTVTMSQVKWLPGNPGGDLLIWYNGAAPDTKLDKKVMPLKDTLFKEFGRFDLAMFDSPEFKRPPKSDFTTNAQNPFIAALYFLLFSIPWIILVGFLAWLVFKRKKRSS